MALETIKDVKEIGGFKVVRDKPQGMSWPDFDKMRNEFPINITDKINCISFKIQNGPIKENGVNGCQVDTIIEAAAIIITGLNDKFPCDENEKALNHLASAINSLKERKINREARGVEGINQK